MLNVTSYLNLLDVLLKDLFVKFYDSIVNLS